MRATDAYAFECANCRTDVEVPVRDASAGTLSCPLCSASYPYRWPAEYPEAQS